MLRHNGTSKKFFEFIRKQDKLKKVLTQTNNFYLKEHINQILTQPKNQMKEQKKWNNFANNALQAIKQRKQNVLKNPQKFDTFFHASMRKELVKQNNKIKNPVATPSDILGF
jgi:hypothetical protein